MVKEQLVLPKDVGSYAPGVVELGVVVGGRVLETTFVYATEDEASSGTIAYDTSSPFVAVKEAVALALDDTDEDIGDESTWPTLEADELDALEVVVCGDCDFSSLLKVFTAVAKFEVDEDDRRYVDEGETGLFGEPETETVVCLK